MERLKPQVTISLDEYNELLAKEKELNDGDFEAYKHVIATIIKLLNPASLQTTLDDLKEQGYMMSMTYDRASRKPLVTVTKTNRTKL